MRPVRVEVTSDGSLTLQDLATGSTYHSRHGARTESLHVFIDSGFHFKLAEGRSEMKVLEMGLGTGLNALLTALEADRHHVDVLYTAVEQFPLSDDTWRELVRHDHEHGNLLQAIHQCPWEVPCRLNDRFTMLKRHLRLQDLSPSEGFDLIYYDAFEPATQPELWTEEMFRKLFAMTLPGGVLVTYCAKGSVRRAMQAAGYVVQRLPGPPFKREIIRAVKG